MQFTTVVAIMLASTASARVFTLYDDINFGGNSHGETRNDDAACCISTEFSETLTNADNVKGT